MPNSICVCCNNAATHWFIMPMGRGDLSGQQHAVCDRPECAHFLYQLEDFKFEEVTLEEYLVAQVMHV